MQEHISSQWVDQINQTKDILIKGQEVRDQINILGDDGVPMNYHLLFWKAELIDFVILQQDAFDKTDAMTPIDRQRFMLELLLSVYNMDFKLESFERSGDLFQTDDQSTQTVELFGV